MDKESVYQAWAPRSAVWSPWVKPVLFACDPLTPPSEPLAAELPDVSWLTSFVDGTALVVDLSGERSVAYGVAVARQLGFRPVPVFASNPPTASWMPAMVATTSIRTGLHHAASLLRDLRLPESAPPAFLLDAHRRAPSAWEVPVNTFDNRSALFASDFPSAEFLQDHGIRRCVLVREPAIPASPDLGYALVGWKKAGIEFIYFTTEARAFEFTWPPAGFWGQLVHRLSVLLTLRPSLRGGYGRFVPESSGG